ncbi:glycerate kinase (GK) [Thermoproteus uzoniensis 768-20]|uniref:Glycerate kinase (GK) n=1 Tax=Thermoproteus uzoniensis (strain 768-20) TaxID=999630 RepID=F2L2W7_THEU7|nr:DUF4147 domain-containing protein [Thermoproteus uzoniensis]AEA11905.1 glycerate kinase (GK) [Thermoproteus uzoniensis 768-20]
MSGTYTTSRIVRAVLSAADLSKAVAAKAGNLGEVRAVAVGKGALSMLKGLEAVADIIDGVAVAPQAGPVPRSVKLYVADHPIPTERSFEAGRAVLDYVESLGRGDTLVLLVSGGASSLMEAPLVSEEDFLKAWEILLKSGMTIHEMNAVRKRLSAIKGGRLGHIAAARGAEVVNLIASDVPCDNPSDVGSGPGVPDDTTPDEAYLYLKVRGLWGRLPESVRRLIESRRGSRDTPSSFPHRAVVVARNLDVLEALRNAVGGRVVTSCLVGEARDVGRLVAYMAKELGTPLILGGEPSVTVRGRGRGGRTSEFALSFALSSTGELAVLALATDGLDGNTGAAGVWADPELLRDIAEAGMDVGRLFEENDTFRPFEATGRAIYTGSTGSNLNLVFYVDRWSHLKDLLAGGQIQEGQI